MTPEERVLEAYYERLTVFPVDKSRVISIEFQSADPELAARVANTIADTYLALQQTRAAGADPRGRPAGSPARSTMLRKRVAEAEAKVEEFRAKTNLFIGTNNTSLSNQTLGEFEPRSRGGALAEGRARVEGAAHPRPAQARRPLESADMLNSELIRRLASSASRCGRSSPSSPRRCSTTIRASRS